MSSKKMTKNRYFYSSFLSRFTNLFQAFQLECSFILTNEMKMKMKEKNIKQRIFLYNY